MNTITRQPRIQGTTFLAQQYNQDPTTTQNTKDKLINQYLTHYLINNYTLPQYEGQTLTLLELSKILQVGLNELQGEVMRRLKLQDRIIGEDGLGQIARASFLGLIFEAQKATNRASYQADILAQAQGPNYVPFLTEQVNRAIANHSASLAPMIALVKMGMPAQPAVQVVNQNNQATVNNHTIGPDEAFKLIESKTAQLTIGGTQHQALLTNKYSLEGLPEIRSNSQQEEAFMAETLRKEALNETGEATAQELKRHRDFEAIMDEDDESDAPIPTNPKPNPAPLPRG